MKENDLIKYKYLSVHSVSPRHSVHLCLVEGLGQGMLLFLYTVLSKCKFYFQLINQNLSRFYTAQYFGESEKRE